MRRTRRTRTTRVTTRRATRDERAMRDDMTRVNHPDNDMTYAMIMRRNERHANDMRDMHRISSHASHARHDEIVWREDARDA